MTEQVLLEENNNVGLTRLAQVRQVVKANAFWASVTISTAVASCAFQTIRYQESIQGVLVVWPIIGLAFAIIKSGVFGVQWQRLNSSVADAKEIFKKRGKILFNLAGLVTLMITNMILLTTLLMKGVEVWHWTTFLTLGVALATAAVWYFYRRRSVDRQLLIIGTGINIIPTYLQGVSYIFRGAAGMPVGSALILMVMSFAMYRQSLPAYRGGTPAERRQRLKLALKEGKHTEVLLPKWDFICQLVAFGLCWGLATFVLPYLGLGWWPFA